MRKAQASEVLIYCIGLLSEEEPRDAEKRQARPEGTGGSLGRAGLLSQGSGGSRTDHAAGGARNPQSISCWRIRPTNPALDGTFRQIKVKVTGYGNATVRTRNGYYASPDSSARTGSVFIK